jgi:CCR4-NOT transcriptional complex subunit CAF120
MVLSDGKKLDNILSLSTAASNKYLFHFNSFNSLTQWTAGIRLAMYEHASLQEAYTGAAIAGKGRQLNNIRTLLDRQRAKYEDWVRVRFGAGTPWRRCWCVVSPPDEKELAKTQKTLKKKDLYNRSPVVVKGHIRFYDTNKIKKKTRPIATVSEAYSCYAIYPQSKQLIDQSTLVKIEGQVTIHTSPEKTTEGFVFVMPETRPAVSGFEIMLQFLFPTFDTFALYGRPNKLVADVLDARGLMFAMPTGRRYGYLEMWDIVGLIHTEGSDTWSERQWRRQLKDLTSKRILTDPRDRNGSRPSTRRNTLSRTSMQSSRTGTLRFADQGEIHSQPTTRQVSPIRNGLNGAAKPPPPARVDSAPAAVPFSVPRHQRSVSEQPNGYNKPSRLSQAQNLEDYGAAPLPPQHRQAGGDAQRQHDGYETPDSQPPSPDKRQFPEMQIAATAPPQGPVELPPTFAHAPGQKPPVPLQNPTMMKPSAHMDNATLDQLADATHSTIPPGIAAAGAAAAWRSQENLHGRRSNDFESNASQNHFNANYQDYSDPYMQRAGHSNSRLPTIPASPFVEQEQFVESSTVYQPTAPPVPEHTTLPILTSRPSEESTSQTRPGTGGSQVQRKPLPGPSSMSLRGDDSRSIRSTTSSSLGSLRNDVIDPEALDLFNHANHALQRQQSQSSSRYSRDDAMSTATPDYASTIEEEIEPKPSASARMPDRPRSGMLKTVGNPELGRKPEVYVNDAHYKPEFQPIQEMASEYPDINFGPTYSLDPNAKVPEPSGAKTEGITATSPPRQSYSGRTTPIAASHMRTTSASPSFDTRSIAWQPGMTSQLNIDRQKLDPEEWVAKRAYSGQPRTPPAFHARSKSHTPPLTRNHSGDWTHLQRTPEGGPARPPSRPLSRPLSRGAERLLDQLPTSLSAREQEHVARITNTPLISLKKDPKHQQRASSAGLTAYIDYREKEKAAAKSNRGTAAMQAEVDRRMLDKQQRQMKEMQQQMEQQMQMNQQRSMTPNGFGAPSIMGGRSMGAPSVMGGPSMGAPSVMGGPSMGAPSIMGTPSMMGTPGGYPQAFAYSSPNQMHPMYQQPSYSGYFPQQGVSPGMQQMQGPYFMQQQQQPMPQQPVTQAYGASFDQAQAAARYAHQQQQQQYRRQ